MSKNIKLRKGFEINLAGKAEKTLEENVQPETFAVRPTDFIGFEKPKVLVKEGDTVKAGTPLYYDKSMPEVQFTSPVSGEVVAVKRGDKRRLLEIRVLADKTIAYESFKKYTVSDIASASREEIVENLTKSGVWPNVIQRPYAVIANPADTPKSIHISAFDSSPLAPDYGVIYKGEDENFATGLEVLKKLTSGSVNLNINGDAEVAPMFAKAKGVQINRVSGKHPAGNVGVQIHNIDPINKGDIVWTLSPYGVIQIGKLFNNGVFDASKVIALVGSEVKAPKYYKTYAGASLSTFIKDNVKSENVRYITGNVLTGEQIQADECLGFYHNTFTVIPDGDDFVFMGSFAPDKKRLSFHKAIGLLSFLNNKNHEYAPSANMNGEHRPFVISGVFEEVLPMDIYPTYLLKAILAEDFEEMEALGIYEVAEEDFALCEFVDPSKHSVQKMIRQGLELMRNS